MLFSGTPGSGKSFHCVAYALECLSRGMNVIANFPISTANYKKRYRQVGEFTFIKNTDLTVEYLLDYAKKHHERNYKAQTLVIVDEAGVIFNTRGFNDKNRMDWIYFFANHRHFNFDFLLVSQMDTMIDRQIRGLIETEYKHRSLKKYKTFGWILDAITGGMFVAVEFWYPCKIRTGSTMIKFNKKVASCYDTLALFIDTTSDEASDERPEQEKEVEHLGRIAKKRLAQKVDSNVNSSNNDFSDSFNADTGESDSC